MSRGDFVVVQNVSISQILLDVGNPRIRDGRDQSDCIARILRKEEQMKALISDIAEKGLTTMPLLVTPVEDAKYVVMDGNRRITALKLLNMPNLCPDERLRPTIVNLVKKFANNIPVKVDVLASSNAEAIAREVLARHSGAQGGVGQLDWSAYLRTVYLLNHGHPPDYKRAGQYALWAEKQGIWVDDEFPISSLQRFFNLENLKLLGFKVEKDELVPTIEPDIAKQMAQTLMTDFGSTKKVDDVKTPDLARTYIMSIRSRIGLAIPGEPATAPPSTKQPTAAPLPPISRPSPGVAPISPIAAPTPTVGPRPAPTPKSPPSERKQLLGRAAPNLPIPESETKARMIIAEIRELDVRVTPLAAAMLLRHFIELSDEYYRKSKGRADVGKLAKNVIATATHMRDSTALTIAEFDIVSRLAKQGGDDLLHIETLQKIMHRDTHHPTYQLINTFWDNIGPFVRACWR